MTKLFVFINSKKFIDLFTDNNGNDNAVEFGLKENKVKPDGTPYTIKNILDIGFYYIISNRKFSKLSLNHIDYNSSNIFFFNDEEILIHDNINFEFKVLYHSLTNKESIRSLVNHNYCKGDKEFSESADTPYGAIAKAIINDDLEVKFDKILSQIGIDEELENELNNAFTYFYIDPKKLNIDQTSKKINDSFLSSNLKID